MRSRGLLRRLPVVVNCGESNFEYEYLREYDAKIEKVYTSVCGPQDVLLGIKNLKNRFRWTVPLRVQHFSANLAYARSSVQVHWSQLYCTSERHKRQMALLLFLTRIHFEGE